MDEKESKNNLRCLFFGDSIKTLTTLENGIRFLLIVCWILAVFPFLKPSFRSRVTSFFTTCYLCLLIIHIFMQYGRPAWNRTVPLRIVPHF